MPSRLPLLFALCGAVGAACSSSPPEPVPGFEGLDATAARAAAPTRVGDDPAARAAAATRGDALPPIPRMDLGDEAIGSLIRDLDLGLRTWSSLMARPRTEETRHQIDLATSALALKVVNRRDAVETQLLSGPPRNRGIAAAALGFSGDPRVVPLLAAATADEDVTVAAHALLGLGVLAAADTPLDPVAQALRRPDATPTLERNAAFLLLQLASTGRIGPDGAGADLLMELVRRPDAKVRAQAALALGLSRAAAAAPVLTDLLAADPSPEVRTAAAWSLGRLGAASSSAALVAALDDPNPVAAGAARAALARIHGRDLGPDPSAWTPVLGG